MFLIHFYSRIYFTVWKHPNYSPRSLLMVILFSSNFAITNNAAIRIFCNFFLFLCQCTSGADT